MIIRNQLSLSVGVYSILIIYVFLAMTYAHRGETADQRMSRVQWMLDRDKRG